MKGNRTFLPLALLLSLGCSHTELAKPEPAKSSGGEPVGQPTDAAGHKMWHHFWDVADARDAVIAGRLDLVAAPLQQLIDTKYGVDELPQDWIPWIEEMQAQAKRGIEAKTLGAAATAVASVAQACGDCHRSTRGGPEIEDHVKAFDAHGRSGLKRAMAQHVWAAEQLWLGMTAPHHQSWAAGAQALSSTPLPPAKDEDGAQEEDTQSDPSAETAETAAAAPATQPGAEPIDPALHAKLDAVRSMGEAALAAGQPAQMAHVYGELIARCGACHASMHVGR
jgi:hypothetical protein